MTACVNETEKKMKGGALTGKAARLVLAGALAVSLTPSIAYAAEDGGSAAYAAAAEASDSFAGGTFAWNVEEAEDGVLQVPAGTTLTLTSAKDAFGTPISVSDCTVVVVKSDNTVTTAAAVKDTVGSYTAYILDGIYDADGVTFNGRDGVIEVDGEAVSQAKQPFEIVKKSLAGAFAYEGKDVTDTTFKYTGETLEINFADADGNELELTKDYTVTGLSSEAGTHTAYLTGAGVYAGSVMVTYTVDPIDLSKDEITVLPILKGNGLFSGANTELAESSIDGTVFLVNGEPVGDGVIKATLKAAVWADGTMDQYFQGNTAANIVLDLEAGDTAGSTNVLNSKAGVSAVVVDQLASFYYGSSTTAIADNGTIDLAGNAFDTAQLTAWVNDGKGGLKQVAVSSVKVTKNGTEVTDWSQPGEYAVAATVNAAADLSYAGSISFKFTVAGNQFTEQPKAYWSLNGKDVKTAEYTGEAIVPTILVKDGKAELTEGEDYEVVYKVAGTDDEVEAMVEPGNYTVAIEFTNATIKPAYPGDEGGAVNNIEISFEITKAQLRSAQADKEVYAYTGEAVTPLFTAYTTADFGGFSIEIDPSEVAVTYYKAKLNESGEPYKTTAGLWMTTGDAIAASQVKDEGFYVATVYAPVDDKHIEGSVVKGVCFEVSKTAGFSDVSSSDWFADPVYKAKELGYINGIQGTTLFAPNAAIDRAQIAAIMFNMAGGQSSEAGSVDENEYPTKFSDVDQTAWYAQAVAWASTYGVVSGYEGTDLFGTFDKATREQVAAMFYNYAKAMGQDVSVADADAALAAYSDGAEVDAWARTAVAWAVENGVMGNGEQLWPLAQISRAEVAAMAVNFQPEKL